VRPVARVVSAAAVVEGGVLMALVIFGLTLAAWCSGCGASALRSHAVAAHVAGVLLDGAHDSATTYVEHELDACVTALDDACVDRVVQRMAPVSVAMSAAEALWSTWVSMIEVAHLSGSSDGLLGALVSMAARALRSYVELGVALEGLGLHLPELPPLVLAYVGAP